MTDRPSDHPYIDALEWGRTTTHTGIPNKVNVVTPEEWAKADRPSQQPDALAWLRAQLDAGNSSIFDLAVALEQSGRWITLELAAELAELRKLKAELASTVLRLQAVVADAEDYLEASE